MLQNHRLTTIVLWVAACVAVLPVIAHLVTGIHNRPMVDDFCFTYDAMRLGILGNVRHLYENWTGTYSSTFFQSVIGLSRLWPLTPVLLIMLWMGAFTALFSEVLHIRPPEQLTVRQRFLLAVILAAIMVAVIVNGTHNVYQSVYWTSGAITYTLPLVINTFSLAVFIHVLRRSSNLHVQLPFLSLLAGLCILAAGFSPLYAVVQVAVWFFLIVGCWLFLPQQWRRNAATAAAITFIFAGIGFLLVALAPGNAIRRVSFNQELGTLEAIIFSARMTVAFVLVDPFKFIPLAVAAGLGGWYSHARGLKLSSRHYLQMLSLAIEVLFILVFLGFFTAVFATDQSPPLRSRIVMHYAVTILMVVIGFISGCGFVQWISRFETLTQYRTLRQIAWSGAGTILVLVIGLNLLQMTSQTLGGNAKLAIFAAEWDAIEAQLQAADQGDDLVVQPFTHDLYVMSFLEPLTTSSNRCMSDYYGVGSVYMLPKAPISISG